MNTITVAAAIILNDQQQLLLVRKRNTEFFMQVGGKLEANEHPEVTILREIEEEIGVKAQIIEHLGRFETAAANEADHQLISYVYHIKMNEIPQVHAEIAELKWVDLNDSHTLLAPLTKEIVIPWCKQQFNVGELV